jgi:hypothetical protein
MPEHRGVRQCGNLCICPLPVPQLHLRTLQQSTMCNGLQLIQGYNRQCGLQYARVSVNVRQPTCALTFVPVWTRPLPPHRHLQLRSPRHYHHPPHRPPHHCQPPPPPLQTAAIHYCMHHACFTGVRDQVITSCSMDDSWPFLDHLFCGRQENAHADCVHVVLRMVECMAHADGASSSADR